MAKSVHGRKVLALVLGAERAVSRSELEQMVAAEFGAEVEFHTCSLEGLSLSELVEMFLGKGKLVEGAGGFEVNADKMCGHKH